jgi:hypothetical protein
LKSDGTVIAWGYFNSGGFLTGTYGFDQPYNNNIVAVYGAQNAFCALKSDGSVVFWGNYTHKPSNIDSLSNVVTVIPGQYKFNFLINEVDTPGKYTIQLGPVDVTAEKSLLQGLELPTESISTIDALTIADNDEIEQSTILIPTTWLLGKTKKQRSDARINATKILFKKNSGLSTFSCKPDQIGLSEIVTKSKVKIFKDSETIDLLTHITDNTALYVPLESVGNSVTFNLDASSVVVTRQAGDKFIVTGDASGTYAIDDKASILGYDMVFGSVVVNQPTGSSVGSVVVNNDGTLTYTPDGTLSNPTGTVYTYNEEHKAYVNTD